jgi:hypothetical protein
MKRSILITFILCMTFSASKAQLWKLKRWEASMGVGPSVFFGDVGGYSRSDNILGIKDMSFYQTRFNVNGNLKYRVTRDLNARLSLTSGLLHATDIRGSNIGRGLEATTTFFEPAVIGEYSFIKNKTEGSYLFQKGKGTPMREIMRSLDVYVYSGIGGINYKVKGNTLLASYRMNNGGFAAVIPVGLGSSLVYSPDLNFGLEIGARYALTDYLDGYTSQYSEVNDVYYLINFTVTYKMKTGKNGLPSFR